jgi:ribonuclease-3
LEEPGTLEHLQEHLGIRFRDSSLLQEAITHSSAKNHDAPCNERLEFLGDSVLGMVIAERLFRAHPDYDEGDLTLVKSEVVSSRTLAEVGVARGFDPFVTVGKGLQREKGLPASLMAGVMEAVIGAIYLDQGLEAARDFILDCLAFHIDNVLANRHRRNYKSILQAYSQKHFGITPVYRVIDETGPDHGKIFEVEARVGKRRFPPGRGSSKKDAEQRAAEFAMAVLAGEAKTQLPVPIASAATPLPWVPPGFRAGRRRAVDGDPCEPSDKEGPEQP